MLATPLTMLCLALCGYAAKDMPRDKRTMLHHAGGLLVWHRMDGIKVIVDYIHFFVPNYLYM